MTTTPSVPAKEQWLTPRRKRHIRDNLVGYSFIFPSIIGFGIFMAYPLIYSLYLSLQDWSMFKNEGTFIGLDNYIAALNNEYFQIGVRNNFLLVLTAVPVLLILSVIVANFLNMNIHGRGLLRAMYFVPYVATATAAAVVFSALFHPEWGPVNSVLSSLGVENLPGWATSVAWALPTIGIFWIWKNLGYNVVIYLAALQGIPRSYYEAASIDGASKFRQFLHITLPLVSPTTFFLLITSMINSFQLFAEVQVLTQGGPGTSTMTLVLHIYNSAFVNFDMGYASAVSWLFFLIVLGITAIQWYGQRKWVNYV